jgi:HAE1 family hydrophobic/amphiphilic exporter-1
MSWLTKIAMKKRWLTFLIVAAVTGFSIWSTLMLQMELIPDIELPVTSVITVYPQAKPEKIMDEVTVHVESAISGMEGLDSIVSTVSEGSTFTMAMFDYGTHMDKVNETIKQNLAGLDLPQEVRNLPATMPQLDENPRLFAIDMNIMPLVMIGVTGDMLPGELEELTNDKITPRLKGIEGVYDDGVTVDGGTSKQMLVNLDADRLNAADLSMLQVIGVLGSQEYGNLGELKSTVIAEGTTLDNIGETRLGMPPGTAISRTNGQTSVIIYVMKEAEANTVTTANAVVDEIEEIKAELQGKVQMFTVLDQSEFIERSIGDLGRNALIGFILAAIVVFFFLMAFRASIVTAISIPLSLLLGFLVMRFLGITINLLTLSAMAIVVGRVIDNSIVVLEVIYRRMQQGEVFRDAAINGVREVVAPITSSTLATVVIFIPIAFIGGIVGEMFMPFALTMTIALIASLIVALMVIPPLSNFKISGKIKMGDKEAWYQRAYLPMLKWVMRHRASTIIIAAAIFLASFTLLPIIGTAFMPTMSEKMLTVEIEMPRGTDLATTEEAAILVEQVIAENPDVTIYQTDAGTSGSLMGGFSSMVGAGDRTATITLLLDPEVDLEQQAADLRRNLEGLVENGKVTVSAGEAEMGAMMGSGLDISIRGDDYNAIAVTGQELFNEIKDVYGIAELELILPEMEPKLDIAPDMAKMMSSGLTMEQLQQVSQEFMIMTMGTGVSKVDIEGETYEIYMNGIAGDLNSAETAAELRVGYPNTVMLGDIATVTLGEQQTNIQRIDEKLAVSITGTITAEDVGAVNMEIQQKINDMDLPEGVEVTMGGVMEMMQESFSGMFVAIIVAILLAYAVIVVTFRSFLKPIIIMVSLPLASIGALVGLLIAGYPLGVSALMGVLMLVGIVLTNAIVLIDLVEKLRRQGMATYDAIIEAGRTRMRPILMTALTTMIAMLPIAVGLGEGAVLSAELAVVVIGGLFSSTLLTLLVIPVLYSFVQGKKRRTAET